MLRLRELLIEEPSQTVSLLAERLGLSLPVASQYLRALESRGLLNCRRVGGRAIYRFDAAQAGRRNDWSRPCCWRFRRPGAPVEMIFKAATAFTHPRRVEIVRALAIQPRTLAELRAATKASPRALARHIAKLEARGFITPKAGRYVAVERADAVGRELARLAVM